MAEDELLTVAQIAAELKASEYTVRRWIKAGQLHAIMPGGTKLGYRVKRSEVERFLRESQKAG